MDSEKTAEYCIGKTVKVFVQDAILIPHPTLSDTYNLTSPGFKKLAMFARLLKPYLESYWVCLNYFMRSTNKDLKPKDRIKKIQSLGLKLYKQREIEQKESLSKINYLNAIEFFASNGIRTAQDKERVETYETTIRDYLKLISS